MKWVSGGLILLLAGVTAFAQHWCPRHEIKAKPEPPIEMLVDLSPEQKTQLENIRIETRKNIIPIKSQIELKEIELQQAMKSDNPDKDKILKLSKEIHELEWQIKKLNIEERLKINSILTPEQKEKIRMHKRRIIKKIEIEDDIEKED
ncbi:MAG: Spy/CpxP family protein refolding chaperone [candidate division WOR-3 bacterium]